jgi:hypothetical protein
MPEPPHTDRTDGTPEIFTGSLALPERIARLVNPDVARARAKVIEERLRERGKGSFYRRQYIEVIANHLLKSLGNG